MKRDELDRKLAAVVGAMVDHVKSEPLMRHLGHVSLPNRDVIVGCIDKLRQVMFPGYFGKQDLTQQTLVYRIGELVNELVDPLHAQVRLCLRYRENIDETSSQAAGCDEAACTIVGQFLDRLAEVRSLLASDVQAAFDSDPAAKSTDETIFCYPGVFAIFVQRLAHELYKLDVPLLPRIMTEYAHSRTGIDIHPGAQLGKSFFIDHGTGVVIGETCLIGDNVKIYQGVTLGALAPHFGQMLRGQKRHPTIEDDVIIYAGATILGGDTIIGKGSVIGGNVFITSTVPPQNQVSAEPPKLKYRNRNAKARRLAELAELEPDFQI